MDVYKEQIVTKQKNKADSTKKICIMIAGFSFAAACFLLTFGSTLSMIGIALAGGALFGAYWLITNLDVEYEYLLTNGDMDFDKITAQRSRKRLCTISLNSAEEFGEYNDSITINASATTVYADDGSGEGLYYVRCKHKSFGDTYVFFTPNEEMLELIKPFLPRTVQRALR